MKDLFLPFEELLESTTGEKSGEHSSVNEIISNLDLLKQSLQVTGQGTDTQKKSIDLSQKIHQAILQLSEPQGQPKSHKASTPKSSHAFQKELLFAYASGQRHEYYQKLWTYFDSTDALLHAPERLLKAHGLPDKCIQLLRQGESRKRLLAQMNQIHQYMTSQHWEMLQTDTLPTPTAISKQEDHLPAVLFVKGNKSLLQRPRISIMGDKQQLSQMYASIMPPMFECLKQSNLVPICNLTQQSSLQFALHAVRSGLPCILNLNFDMMKSVEKRYRYLTYFLDHGCVLVSGELPFSTQRSSYLHAFRMAMALSKLMFIFPKYVEKYDIGDYSSRYWPVLNHCHQEDKVCLLHGPPDQVQASEMFKSWEQQDASVIVYDGIHPLRILLQTLETRGHLNAVLSRKVLGSVSTLHVIH